MAKKFTMEEFYAKMDAIRRGSVGPVAPPADLISQLRQAAQKRKGTIPKIPKGV